MRQMACNATLEGMGHLNGRRYVLHDRKVLRYSNLGRIRIEAILMEVARRHPVYLALRWRQNEVCGYT
jgi:hypothetical protein